MQLSTKAGRENLFASFDLLISLHTASYKLPMHTTSKTLILTHFVVPVFVLLYKKSFSGSQP